MTNHTSRITDPATLALSHLARAAEHDDDANTAAAHNDLGLARSFYAASRAEIRRAQALAEISHAEHLARIADALDRLALSR